MGAAVKRIGGKGKVRHVAPKRQVASPIDKAKAGEVDWHHVPQVFETVRRGTDFSFVYFIGEEDEGATLAACVWSAC